MLSLLCGFVFLDKICLNILVWAYSRCLFCSVAVHVWLCASTTLSYYSFVICHVFRKFHSFLSGLFLLFWVPWYFTWILEQNHARRPGKKLWSSGWGGLALGQLKLVWGRGSQGGLLGPLALRTDLCIWRGVQIPRQRGSPFVLWQISCNTTCKR